MRFRTFGMSLAVFLMAFAVGIAADGKGNAAPAKASSTSSCAQSAPFFLMPNSPEQNSSKKPDPMPEPVVCLINICKMDGGVLYHCVAHVCADCCRYDTSLDCTADPSCSYNIPAYCDSGTNCPPKACKKTCGPNTCGTTLCH